jgi:hypothetical protein
MKAVALMGYIGQCFFFFTRTEFIH